MKQLLVLGAGMGMMLAAGAAVAQAPAPAPDAPPPPPSAMGETTGRHGMGPEDMGKRPPMGPMMMHRMMEAHRPPPSKAAHFRFRRGDALVDIKCADDEPTKACVDAGSALLDKLASQPR